MDTRGFSRRLRSAACSLLVFIAQAHFVMDANAASLVATSTAVSSTPNPSSYGQGVTFTATVSASAGTPTGTVEFSDGGVSLGTAGLSGAGAQFTTSFLTQGSHTITATYSGDAGYAGSTSPPLVQTVNASSTAPTSTSVLSSLNPSNQGAAVTFTVTVFAIEGTPTGTVRFLDGATTLGSSTLSNRRATFTTRDLSAGSHPITAVYGGDNNYAGSVSPVLTQVVIPPPKTPTSTSVASLLNPSPSGQSVTFTVIVTGAGGTPTGSVQFYDGGSGLAVTALVDGRGSLQIGALAVGGHSITARYSGDDRFAGSTSSELVQVVTAQTLGATSTTLVSSANPSVLGQTVTFAATVSTGSGTPAGSVQFYDSGALLGSANLDGGRALVATSALAVGSHSITAVYGGDGEHLGSTSAPLAQAVNRAPGAETSTTLASSVNQSTAGQAVTFTATVSSSSGTPTGSAQFLDSGVLLGTAGLEGGRAQFTTSSLAAGTRLIRAIYSGDNSYSSSSSSALPHTVLPGDSRPVLSSNANPSVRGQAVTFEAQMGPSCEGTVSFLGGAALVGSAILEPGGRSRLTVYGLTVGTHRMVAVYAGGVVCPAATSAVLEQVVQPAGTATVIGVAAAPSGASGAFVLTATTQVLPPGSGTPGGEVVFRDGETVLGSSNLSQAGAATLAVNLNPAPPHGIAAQYTGNAEFAASASVRLTDLTDLAKPDFEAAYVVNSASFAPGLSPGAFATIFGSRLSGGATVASSLPYPNAVQGVQVTLNGRPVQLVYLSDQQINFVVPSDETERTASLVVSTPLGSSKAVTTSLVAASPGIFADPVSGYGAVLIAGTAETTLTRPVRAGEYIEIYCTGLGAVDASSRTMLPVTVNLGSLRLTPSYSGLNPVYPGLYQVNVQIPQGLAGQQTLSIEVNGRRSNEVKIRIQ